MAFVALFAAMGGFGYAAVKMKPNSVRTKNIKSGAVTTDKIADGAVTTPKLAPDAVAPNATNAVNAMNAAKLGGVGPASCQTGWLKASLRSIDTDERDDGPAGRAFRASTAPARPLTRCRSRGKRSASTPSPWPAMTRRRGDRAERRRQRRHRRDDDRRRPFLVKVWNNSDAAFVDGKSFSLIAF